MGVITPSDIQQLKSIYPSRAESSRLHAVLSNPWYLVAAVAFNAARRPEAVVSVYQAVLEDLRAHGSDDVDVDDHATLVRRIKEALLKASITNGIPRAVTTILSLNSVVPKVVLEKLSSPLRDFTMPFSDLELKGGQFLNELFGVVEGRKAHDLIKASYPDSGIFMLASYGLVVGDPSVVSSLETSYCFITASILDEFPRQVDWFYLAALHQGATVDETKAIREMSLKVASLTNVTFREKVPEVVAKELIRPY